MNNIVTFCTLVIILLASFQTVDSIQIFTNKYREAPDKLLKYGVVRLATIFLALTSLAYLLELSSWIINSILILMAIVIAIFVLFAKTMCKNNIN